jgi:hypothetical protein
MSRPRAEYRLTDAEKVRLSRAIAKTSLAEGDYRRIYEELGVGQPFVSLALHGRLVARTAKVDRLFEYLGVERDDPAVAAATERSDRAPLGVRGLVAPVDALLALSDGTSEQDGLLLDLLDAVRRLAEARSGERAAKEQVGDH